MSSELGGFFLVRSSCPTVSHGNHFKFESIASLKFFFSSRRRHTRCRRDWSSDVCSSDLGRPASMAKFTYVGPRLSLTGMNADEWIAPKPGSEGLLALAMAQVIMSQHLARVPADASKLVSVLAAHTPRAVAQVIGIDEATIARLAREFARSGGGLAVAGGMATQAANGAEIVAAVNILNYVV